MSALAHMLEERGFATTAIALSRDQVEKVKPPRALWTPFQLGRPMGEPEDPAFQRRVLMQTLKLLERTDGPVILEDFADDPPGWTNHTGWQPPLPPAATASPDHAALVRQFADELEAIHPVWQAAQARFGRTTVGLSAEDPTTWPAAAASLLESRIPAASPYPTLAKALRYQADDIKALYYEAAQAKGEAPASRQIDTWFWRETIAGHLLITLRTMAMVSEDPELNTVGARFLVPVIHLPPATA